MALPLPDFWTCYKCGKTKSIGEFPRNAQRARGFDYCCNECTSKRRKAHYEKNRAAYLKRSSEWWRQHPNERRSRDQAYRENNREKIREKDRKWRERNRAADRARKKADNSYWLSRTVRHCRKRAKEKNIRFSMTAEDLLTGQPPSLPVFCPIFPHIKLDYSAGPDRRSWASVDRKVPELGYTSGNVWVISVAANTWKSNGSNPVERKIICEITAPPKKVNKNIDGQMDLFGAA